MHHLRPRPVRAAASSLARLALGLALIAGALNTAGALPKLQPTDNKQTNQVLKNYYFEELNRQLQITF